MEHRPPAEHPTSDNISILLIDDDVELGQLMREYFEQRGMSLEVANDSRRGLNRGLRDEHDLILLDVMLPGIDGFEVLRQLRRRTRIPIIMLTARTARDDRISGLEAGADDYLPKPFEPDELIARIRAVLRRSGRTRPSGLGSEVLDVNGVRVESGTRRVWVNENPVEVTSIEFDILEFIVRSAGRIVSRDELTSAIYQRPATPFDRSLDVHVSHLRKKLGVLGGLIRTVRGVGYLFSAEGS